MATDTPNNNTTGFDDGYDEQKAVSFIRAFIPDRVSQLYSDDEILYVIDCIWEFYEKKGLLSLEDIESEEDLLSADDITAYVRKCIAIDKEILMDPQDVEYIVKGELEYEKTLEDLL